MDSSKEELSFKFNPKFQIQSMHYKAISHCMVFAEQELLITIGNDGQLNLYRQNPKRQYEHQTTNKVFHCPVVAYDLLQDDDCWKLVLISFENRIAACRIVEKKAIVVFRQLHFQQKDEAIASCVWGKSRSDLILGGVNGHIFILDLDSKEKAVEYDFQTTKLRLVRCGEDIYAGTKDFISKLVFQINIASVVLLCQKNFEFNTDILDFAVTQKEFFNFIVVLTKDKLYFFYMEDLNLRPQLFALKNKAETGRLGWGKDSNEIAIYTPMKHGTDVQLFTCNLSGLWSRALV